MAKSIQKAGYGAFHLVSAENHIFTKPELHPFRMLLQRKRWIGAFMQLNPVWITGLAFRLLLPWALLYLANYQPWWALSAWFLHLLLQAGIIRLMYQKTGTQVSDRDLRLFEFYFLGNSLLSCFLYFWPSKVLWKDRK